MKNVFMLFFLFPLFCLGKERLLDTNYGQNNDSLMSVYQKRVDSLQAVVNDLILHETQRNKVVYDKTYRNARTAIDVLEQLNNTVYSMLADQKDAEKYNILSQVNSPASDKLGFTFSEKIVSISEQVISSSSILNDQKARLKSSIFNIVDGLKTVFPPLSIISTVVSTIGSFNYPFINKLDKKMKEGDSLAVKVVNPVTGKMLKQFADSIMPYIKFYEKLNEISLLFQNDLKKHRVEYADYYTSIISLKNRYNNELGINISSDPNPINDALDNLYEKANLTKNTSFYSRVLNKDEIKKLNDFSWQALALAKKFKPFYDDYYKILVKHFEDNLNTLKDAKLLSGSDSKKIEDLIEELKNLRTGENETSPGFEKKFKKNLEKISNSLISMTGDAA